MASKIIISIIVIIIIAAGGYYYWEMYMVPKPVKPVPQEPVSEPVETYASSTLGISVSYLKGYTVNDAYAYDQFGPKKLINGVKITIPMTMATGTNLSSDTGISVEWLPRAKTCTGDIYIQADVGAVLLTDGGVKYSVATSSGVAAGNLYEEKVYAIASSTPCTAVRYFIHSTNIGNYPPAGEPGAVREFDHNALLREFDKIRQSLKLSR